MERHHMDLNMLKQVGAATERRVCWHCVATVLRGLLVVSELTLREAFDRPDCLIRRFVRLTKRVAGFSPRCAVF